MKKIIKWLLLASLALGAGQLALASAQAADATPAAPSATSSADQAEQPTLAERQAKAEKKKAAAKKAAARFAKCEKCHDGEEGMHGKHGQVTNPNTGEQVTCTNCHGNASADHRKQRGGMVDVMRFGNDAFPLSQQNGVCMSCHEPDDLRKALWAHDVHATRVSCTSCHQLHPAKEPMVGIPEKSRIKLCVDCHRKQHEAGLGSAVKEGA
ncbi:TPA: Nrf-like electron transfer protein NetB [Aeromonas hydrophila]|uniref:Nrf-like electron transfer protein NetB n=1 Tax=Aeromonas sp. 2692-1 TaxID=2560029 RepID=UPI00148B1CA6|nr:cytochrome c nitrite reductase pentaheme subunit [Aeromonas sp. 2692-1]QJT14830.1 cytochrome c nitrite reductase pentaheme subunit [Aeromonas sp. 2692-1]